jgi:protein TonB
MEWLSEDSGQERRRWPLPVFAVAAAIGVVVWLMPSPRALPSHRRVVQPVAIMPQPPPPLPPERIETKPKPVEIPKPEPKPAPKPPREKPPEPQAVLGLDAEGKGDGDGFGLVGRPGRRTLIGGGGGNANVWYGQQFQRQVAEVMDAELRDRKDHRRFMVVMEIWVSPEGRCERSRLVGTSGDPATDARIAAAAARMNLQLPPPERMPQPVRIRIRG